MQLIKPYFLSIYSVLILFSCAEQKSEVSGLVRNMEEYNAAVVAATPGSTITLANGIWMDAELIFKGVGTKEAPITLQAEQAGKVTLEGASNLLIGGEYLVVKDIVFKNGFTPTSEVIAFRIDKKNLANNCRVTNCVIDDYNNPERFEADLWVAMFGKNNMFDHNTLVNKRNQGVTMAVRMDTEESRDNNHIIEKNYFGPRPNLGSNGGETLRIGTSHYSRSFSNTLVQNNYFDRCNGEHEIISNKSCGNIFDGNVFYECRGTLTMRHGHHTLVENNFFFGNGKANTGGIRVINENQTVKNNYAQGLTGYRFRGAFVIMNGVPNSPINRYNQVVDSDIEGNLFIDCDHIQLCAGSDEERSATPVGSSLTKNIFFSKTNLSPFTVYDDISGIRIEGNYINEEATVQIKDGFKKVPYEVTKNKDGLLLPPKALLDEIGFKVTTPITKAEVGADYYTKEFKEDGFRVGKEIVAEPGTNTLLDAMAQSAAGDIIKLKAGQYLLTKDFKINHPITILGADSTSIVMSRKSSFFKIENGGSLELADLTIDGAESPDQPGNNVVSTSKYSMPHNYKVFVRNSVIKNLVVNHTFDFLKVYKNTFADTVLLENTSFTNISGSVLSFDKETEDLGIYNVEHVLVEDCKFNSIEGAAINVYRGGTDESTFGPIVRILNTEFAQVGKGKRNKTSASVLLHGAQDTLVEDCKWSESAPFTLELTNGEPVTHVVNCEFSASGKIIANDKYTSTGVKYLNQ